ncbi:phage capsid family protein [Clostridium sp. BNL1100]|nr:phage capsid family protein [Clostridium sp. BNL1100]
MLKQLKLQAELKQRNAEMQILQEKRTDFKKRQDELKTALEEAKTDEDIALVQQGIDDLENEITEAGTDEKITSVSAEITRIEGEIAEIEARGNNPKPPKKEIEERGGNSMNRYQVRELLKTGEYYERAEVKEFYNKFKNLRAIGGEGLTIPEVVINRIMDILGDYSTLYPLVDRITVKGTARILIDTDTTAATWIEQTGTIPTGEVGTITDISFDGYKIGKVTFVDNSMLQDSIINLDDYVVKKIARAISIGLDLAILKGTGATGKQPEGIIPQLPTSNKVIVTDPTGYADIVKPIAVIDTGKDSIGEIVAVMKRSTYYNRLLGYSVQPTSTGEVVAKLPNLKNPDLLGLRVVFNNNMTTIQSFMEILASIHSLKEKMYQSTSQSMLSLPKTRWLSEVRAGLMASQPRRKLLCL